MSLFKAKMTEKRSYLIGKIQNIENDMNEFV